jgi:hypothetical protein
MDSHFAKMVEGKTTEEIFEIMVDMIEHPEKSIKYVPSEDLLDGYRNLAGTLALFDIQTKMFKEGSVPDHEDLIKKADEKRLALIEMEKEIYIRALAMPNSGDLNMEYINDFLEKTK